MIECGHGKSSHPFLRVEGRNGNHWEMPGGARRSPLQARVGGVEGGRWWWWVQGLRQFLRGSGHAGLKKKKPASSPLPLMTSGPEVSALGLATRMQLSRKSALRGEGNGCRRVEVAHPRASPAPPRLPQPFLEPPPTPIRTRPQIPAEGFPWRGQRCAPERARARHRHVLRRCSFRS